MCRRGIPPRFFRRGRGGTLCSPPRSTPNWMGWIPRTTASRPAPQLLGQERSTGLHVLTVRAPRQPCLQLLSPTLPQSLRIEDGSSDCLSADISNAPPLRRPTFSPP